MVDKPSAPPPETSTAPLGAIPGKPPLDTATFGEDPLEAMRKNAEKSGAIQLNINDVTAAVHSLAFRKVGPSEIDDFAEMDDREGDLPHGLPKHITEDGIDIPVTYRRVRPEDLQDDPLVNIGLQPIVRNDPRFKGCTGPFNVSGWLQQRDSVVCFISTERLRKWKQKRRDRHLGTMIAGLEYQEHRIRGDVPGIDGKYKTHLEITEKGK